MKVYYCNKCECPFKEGDLNPNEMEEIQNSLRVSGVPSFVCSSCINDEMGKE